MDIENKNIIDDEKLAAAKEKLACHIEPPWARKAHEPDPQDVPQETAASSLDAVRLTQMTSAGG